MALNTQRQKWPDSKKGDGVRNVVSRAIVHSIITTMAQIACLLRLNEEGFLSAPSTGC